MILRIGIPMYFCISSCLSKKVFTLFFQKILFSTFIIDGFYDQELSCEGRIDLKGKKKWLAIILVSFDFSLRSVIITSDGEKI
jgi:hypothetical protein